MLMEMPGIRHLEIRTPDTHNTFTVCGFRGRTSGGGGESPGNESQRTAAGGGDLTGILYVNRVPVSPTVTQGRI